MKKTLLVLCAVLVSSPVFAANISTECCNDGSRVVFDIERVANDKYAKQYHLLSEECSKSINNGYGGLIMSGNKSCPKNNLSEVAIDLGNVDVSSSALKLSNASNNIFVDPTKIPPVVYTTGTGKNNIIVQAPTSYTKTNIQPNYQDGVLHYPSSLLSKTQNIGTNLTISQMSKEQMLNKIKQLIEMIEVLKKKLLEMNKTK
jgi:hypothetical protein